MLEFTQMESVNRKLYHRRSGVEMGKTRRLLTVILLVTMANVRKRFEEEDEC